MIFQIKVKARAYRVEAEKEGVCRFMVRRTDLSRPEAAPVRIGYLTGRAGHWVGDHAGLVTGITGATAEGVCEALLHSSLESEHRPARRT